MAETMFDLTGGNVVNAAQDKQGLVLNLTDVEDQTSFELLPKGVYPAVVEELEFGESSNGNPMITAKFCITDPQYENRFLWDYWVLAGNGAEFGLAKLKKFLVRVCPEVDLSNFNPKEFVESGIAYGRECRLKVAIQTQKKGEYKGEKRNVIRDIFSVNSDENFLGV